MKSTIRRLGALLAIGAALLTSSLKADQIAYTGLGLINFDTSGNFSFSPTATNFLILNDTINPGATVGLLGEITGTFAIGTVTPVGPNFTAAVTGTGGFAIHDGANLFSADLNWVSITQTGTSGALNTAGFANLTNISYLGSNATLIALRDNASGPSNSLNFTFNDGSGIESLKTSGGSTTFSGSVSLPDGGATVILLGFGLSAVALFRRKLRA